MLLALLATWARCWLLPSRLPTGTPRPFPPRHFPAALPQPGALRGAGVTPGQDPALGPVEPHTSGLGPRIQPAQTPLRSLLPSSRSAPLPSRVLAADSLRGHSIPSPRSQTETRTGTGPSAEPWGTPRVPGRQLDVAPFPTPLWARPASQPFTQPGAHTYRPRAAGFPRRCCGTRCQRLY